MRTTLLVSLVSVSFGVAALSLAIVHSILKKQIHSQIAADLAHSIMTFQNLQSQRRAMLERESALVADLPVLKSLMTTEDAATIRDGAAEFYRLSGGDLFALSDRSGRTVALYEESGTWNGSEDPRIADSVFTSTGLHYVLRGKRLYEVSSMPLYFGSPATGTRLGYVAIGYAINDAVAKQVREAASADVLFAANGEIVATTLDDERQKQSIKENNAILKGDRGAGEVFLGGEHYVRAVERLSRPGDPVIDLAVLKSYDQASAYLRQLNRLLLGLAAAILLVSVVLAFWIASNVTYPLEKLVSGVRALGAGDFRYELRSEGAREIKELSVTFEKMRVRLERSQQELLAAERLATIGRMASSISHDLRHYLSAVYANAEFLGYEATRPEERAELLAEVRRGVQGMTELIDSLLLFSRTGQPLQPSYESLPFVAERALSHLRNHPDAQNVAISFGPMAPVETWMDALKIERAIYNLLLNGCQAAKHGSGPAAVSITLDETDQWIRLQVTDNGPGVPESIRVTLFQPFVSEGKQGGVGLGLTLANKIAEEHGGSVNLERSGNGRTVFVLTLAKATLRELAVIAQSAESFPLVSE
jgi:signal transduction histidine kinase